MALRRLSTRKRRTKVDHVGFSSLPEQVHRKSLKKGFDFTLLVVGDSGLGKSTLVNSLFMTDLYSERVLDQVTDRIEKTVSITTRTAELEEKGVRLKLTVVDTPGFGDSINSDYCWKKISEYIDEQFYSYYKHESGYGLERKKLQDTRVHCCLYFIPPYVRGLRPIDIETMKCLQTRVNIVPVIGKADSLTKKELEILKKNILEDIDRYEIKTYEFPICDSDDDEEFRKLDEEIKSAIPFGIIGSNTTMEVGNKRIRGRAYPWGIIDIESNVCDFSKLRTFLCSSHMHDLKDLTHDIHYENYRTELIQSQQISESKNKINSHQNSHTYEETDKLLQQKEMELKKMQELIAKMKLNMNNNTVLIDTNGKSNGSALSSQTLPVQNMSSFGKQSNQLLQGQRTLNKSNSNEIQMNKNMNIYNYKPINNYTYHHHNNHNQTSSTPI